ncbi:MAG: hypothetical protein ACI4JN_07195 [Ruminococcus sp.]
MKKIVSSVLALSMTAGMVLTGCSGVDKNFSSDYVVGIMDASYKGEFKTYMAITESTEEEAKELYDSTVKYYTESIAMYCEIYTEDISEEIYDEYTSFTEELLSKAKYTVSSAENGKESCYIKVSIKPINILEQVNDEIEACVDEYNATFEQMSEEELAAVSDEEFREYEDEYARNVLEVLKKGSENLEYKDSLDFTMEILIDDDGLYAPANEDDWNTIDDYVMGLYE